MKEVMAIIRMNKMNQTKQALADAGVASFTARKVMGRGKGKVDYLLMKGAEAGCEEAIVQLGPGPKLIPKRLLNVVVPDDLVTLGRADDHRGEPDGQPRRRQVFVMPVSDAFRVRTGEPGDAALDETVCQEEPSRRHGAPSQKRSPSPAGSPAGAAQEISAQGGAQAGAADRGQRQGRRRRPSPRSWPTCAPRRASSRSAAAPTPAARAWCSGPPATSSTSPTAPSAAASIPG